MSKFALTLAAFAGLALAQPFPTYSVMYRDTGREQDAGNNGELLHVPDHFQGQWSDGTTVTYTTGEKHPGVTAFAVNYYAQGIGVSRNTSTNLITVGGNGKPIPIPRP